MSLGISRGRLQRGDFLFILLLSSLNSYGMSESDEIIPPADDNTSITDSHHADVLYPQEPAPGTFQSLFPDSVYSNEWMAKEKWTANTPGRRRGHAASYVRAFGADGKVGDSMVLYGGVQNWYSQEEKEFWKTWIYMPATNSWRSVSKSGRRPPHVYGHTMVTLCNTTVLLFGGNVKERNTAYYPINETWSFKGGYWDRLPVETDSGIEPRSYHAAAAVHQRESSCACHESMLVFGGSQMEDLAYAYRDETKEAFDDLWELRCKKGERYVWIRLDTHQNKGNGPSGRYKPAAASHFDIMYIFGGCKFGSEERLEICIPYRDLWSYSTSTNSWKEIGEAKWSQVEGLLHAAFVTRKSYRCPGHAFSGILLCCKKPFRFYDIGQNTWHMLDTLDSDENYEDLLDASVSVINRYGDIIVYGGADNPSWIDQDSLWNITMLAPDSCLLHSRPVPSLVPPFRGSQIAVVDHDSKMLIVHGGLRADTMFEGKAWGEKNSGIWVLNMNLLTWYLRKPTTKLPLVGHVGVFVSYPEKALVTFGGLKIVDDYTIAEKSTWGYYPIENTWFEYDVGRLQPETCRSAAAVAIDDKSMLMVGGVTPNNTILNSTWIFKVGKKRKIGKWTRVVVAEAPQRFGHTVARVGGGVLLYGGAEPSGDKHLNCSDELWEFDLSRKLWIRLQYAGIGPGTLCFHSATGSGEKLVVAGGCQWDSNYDLTSLHVFDVEIEHCVTIHKMPRVWYYSTRQRLWNEMTPLPFKDSAYILGKLLKWGDNTVVAFGGYSVPRNWTAHTERDLLKAGFLAKTLGCPAGTEGTKFWDDTCKNCPIGHFSKFNWSNCQKCQSGFTTPYEGATGRNNCTLCDVSEEYCHHGTCHVAEDLVAKDIFVRRCSCRNGFTRNHEGKCVVPTAFAAISGALVFIVAGICITLKIAKKVRARRATSERQATDLEAMTQVWKINPREITLMERIDSDSPGGFGEVYKAEYREMTVAVKKLQDLQSRTGRCAQDFDREIKVMRTLRHPNIVMFFGGGRFEEGKTPFLVVEYMPRGSLGGILKDASVHLASLKRIDFALDAAEGMAFLHSLRPPRIHRDLKSFNLLVSDRWIVKVADFGAARLVRQEGVDQIAHRTDEISTSLQSPLLEADATMSTNCGSLLWTAPELLMRNNYGTPVDLYSFGIVLWEIWQRELPYYDRGFRYMHEIQKLVCDGTRPTIQKDIDWPSDILSLMHSCWQHDPRKRPTFSSVVIKLQEVKDSLV